MPKITLDVTKLLGYRLGGDGRSARIGAKAGQKTSAPLAALAKIGAKFG